MILQAPQQHNPTSHHHQVITIDHQIMENHYMKSPLEKKRPWIKLNPHEITINHH